ncbi:sigma 54-interacting transcriptional regulator [Pseudomonas aeruginosa]|nr:sigma 54-interacting transcriptional regulator [Pseudomonas aeruginosa]
MQGPTCSRFLQEQQIERVGGSRRGRSERAGAGGDPCRLEAAIDAGTFREDLYYQLHVCRSAPRRCANGQGPAAVASISPRLYSLETGRRPRRFSEDALAAMAMHAWPGNVHETGQPGYVAGWSWQRKQIEAQDLGLECARGDGPPLSSLEVYKLCAERRRCATRWPVTRQPQRGRADARGVAADLLPPVAQTDRLR